MGILTMGGGAQYQSPFPSDKGENNRMSSSAKMLA